MGTDKALISIDGVALAARVAAALAGGGCDPVVCHGGDAEALGRLGLRVVADTAPGFGPLHAIADALTAAAPSDVVVSACDLPGLDAPTVARLIAVADEHPAAGITVAVDRSGPHLVSVWRQTIVARLSELLDDGVRSYREALDRLDAVRVDVPSSVLVNVNRPRDLP
jgi:molybdopterin-guanine dinucleotide biosynthesis protein A